MNKLFSLLSFRQVFDYSRSASTRLTAQGKEIPKEKKFVNRITLISPDKSVSITDLEKAQSLSQRRDLKLVKVQDEDTKTRRPVYKLMTNSEYHDEELQRRKEKQQAKQNNAIKGEKLLTFSTKIGEHDLLTNVNKMSKLVQKHYEVRVIISSDNSFDTEKLETMYSTIEKHVKDLSKIVQKRMKGNSLRFQLLPKEKTTDASNKNDGQDRGPL